MYRAVVFAALAFYRYVLRDSIPRLCQQAIWFQYFLLYAQVGISF